MHDCDHLKCLNVSVSRVGGNLTITTNRLVSDIQVDVKPISRLFVSASVICSVNKDSNCWKWDAGEILLWDNNILIDLEWE